MRIIGIDPGYAIIGWAVADKNLKLFDFGVIETASTLPFDERLIKVHNEINGIILKHKPDILSIEKLFFQKNTKTAIDVARTSGAILLTAKIHGLTVLEYSPVQIKQAVTGYGKATKEQMQSMIKTIFKLKTIPEPDDAADAVAAALCGALNCSRNIQTAS